MKLNVGKGTTVDGRNPAPVDMVNIPLFTWFYRSQVVQDFSHQQYGNAPISFHGNIYPQQTGPGGSEFHTFQQDLCDAVVPLEAAIHRALVWKRRHGGVGLRIWRRRYGRHVWKAAKKNRENLNGSQDPWGSMGLVYVYLHVA